MRKANSKLVYESVVVSYFSEPESKDRLHPELLRFKERIKRFAVSGFTVKDLKAHYEQNFYKARITYVYKGRKGGELVAFFIAAYKIKNGNYYGSGFPCIKHKYRRNKEDKKNKHISVDFNVIMGKLITEYVQYYYENVLRPQKIEPVLNILRDLNEMFKSPSASLLSNKALSVLINALPLFAGQKLTIIATAENPIMYAKLMALNLKFQGADPRPSDSDLKKVTNWSSVRLIRESYLQLLKKEQHPCLITPPFSVDISAAEWRNFFVNVDTKSTSLAPYIKYFLWQNFNFPNTAFLFEFKVNMRNIYQVLYEMYF